MDLLLTPPTSQNWKPKVICVAEVGTAGTSHSDPKGPWAPEYCCHVIKLSPRSGVATAHPIQHWTTGRSTHDLDRLSLLLWGNGLLLLGYWSYFVWSLFPCLVLGYCDWESMVSFPAFKQSENGVSRPGQVAVVALGFLPHLHLCIMMYPGMSGFSS